MAKITISPKLKTVQRKIEKNWVDSTKTLVKKLILERIGKGLSPVKGKGAYQKYSDSYKKGIRQGRYSSFSKRIRPINLELTGKMLRSIKARVSGTTISVWFTDKKAKWHNKGMGRNPERRMIPLENEVFSSKITKELEKDLEKIIKKAFK